MPLSLNRVQLAGVLTADPTPFTGGGKSCARFQMQTTERWKAGHDAAAGRRDDVHRVVIYNPVLAEICLTYARRGTRVFIEGALQNRTYVDEGIEKTSVEVALGAFKSTFTIISDGADAAQENAA
jgi:single-strand DNA-binding protein